MLSKDLKHLLTCKSRVNRLIYPGLPTMPASILPAAINALLRLFLDSAHSVAIRWQLHVHASSCSTSQPGQVPILAADQPAYARQANPVDLANYLRRGPLHSDVRWLTPRDGYLGGILYHA